MNNLKNEMMNESTQTLYLTRIFDAPQQVVFDYFTIPELVCTWWGPEDVTTINAEINLHIEGDCRWEMRDANDSPLLLHGKILEVIPPERLVMSHQWQNDNQITIVTLEFISLGEQTKLLLTQTGISQKLPLNLYDDWWLSTFTRLQNSITF